MSQDGGDPQELAEEVAAPDTASVQNGFETCIEVNEDVSLGLARQSSVLASRGRGEWVRVRVGDGGKLECQNGLMCVAAPLKDSSDARSLEQTADATNTRPPNLA